MPYISYLFCENCGPANGLDIDYQGTINAYITEGRRSPGINPPTLIWDYLIYQCPSCQASFKYTYRDVESRVREYFVGLSDKHRKYFDDREIYDNRIDSMASKEIITNSTTRDRIAELYTKKE